MNAPERCEESNYRALQASESLLRLITDSMLDIVAIVDKEAIFRYISPSVETVLGFAPEELIGKTGFLYVHAADIPTVSQQFFRCWEEQETARAQYRGLRADGSYLWLEAYGTPILDDKGNTIAANLIIRDIDERISYERELEQLNQDLRAFAHTLSHDLKSPLSNAYGYAITIERLASEHLDDMSRKGIRIIKDSLESMSAIIDGMLAYTRMGNDPEEDRVVDLRKVAEDILDELGRGGRLEGPSFTIRPELPVVNGDPTRFRQVLGNLLSNAVKFGEEGREVQVEVGHLVSNGQSTVYVRDNGHGIENEDLQKIFEPLERAGTTRDIHGYGLGLAIVQRAVQSWGGRVWAESEPGQGSTFYFTLPA